MDPISAETHGGDVLERDYGNERCCFGFVLMKGKVVPGEQSRKCPCQACVIFKGSTDGYWDELPFFGTALNRGGILCCVVLQHSPERFSQRSLLFAQK